MYYCSSNCSLAVHMLLLLLMMMMMMMLIADVDVDVDVDGRFDSAAQSEIAGWHACSAARCTQRIYSAGIMVVFGSSYVIVM